MHVVRRRRRRRARLGRSLRVAHHHVRALDDHLVLLGHGLQDFAALALVLAGDHLDGVALFDFELDRLFRLAGFQSAASYSTSGARETIFMKSCSRSSRATGPKMRVPRGSMVVLDHDGGIVIEAQHRAVRTADRLLGAHDDAFDHVALLDLLVGRRGLHDADDHIADVGIARIRAFHDADAHDFARAGVIGAPQTGIGSGSSLYFAFSTIRTTRQRFSLESGRVSMISTVSPSPQVLSRHAP